jgi:hypothetical protein
VQISAPPDEAGRDAAPERGEVMGGEAIPAFSSIVAPGRPA